MGYEIPGFSWTLTAGEDLSSSRYCGVDIDANGEAVLPDEGGRIVAVIRNKPTDGNDATCVSDGIVMALIGATGVVAGNNVTVDDDGSFIQAASGDIVHGIALKTNAADEIGTVLLNLNSALSGS